jgi:hypothetical protein
MTRQTQLPALSSVSTGNTTLDNWIRAVTEHLQVREGDRGSPDDRVVTLRDLKTLGLDTSSWPTTGSPAGGILVRLPSGGYAQVPFSSFADSLRGTQLYADLIRNIDDPTRFEGLSSDIKNILLSSLADEAAARGAAITHTKEIIQSQTQSLAVQVDATTAALNKSVSGIREVTFATANDVTAQAGKITEITAGLDATSNTLPTTYPTVAALKSAVPTGLAGKYYKVTNPVAGQPVLLFKWDAVNGTYTVAGKGNIAGLTQSMIATADRDAGSEAQYTLKVTAGGKIAGFGLSATDPIAGGGTSAFIVNADKFALVTSTTSISDPTAPPTNLIPFGVDASGVYINGSIRVNSGGATIGSFGSGSAGITGAVYYQGASAPAAPTASTGSYNFTTNVLIPPTGSVTWSTSVPTVGTNPTYASYYTFTGTGTVACTGAWSGPVAVGQQGVDGKRGPMVTKITGAWNASTAATQIASIATAAGSTPTTPIKGDIVYYTGGANECTNATGPVWGTVAAYIDGSLIVTGTVSSSQIATGTITVGNLGSSVLDYSNILGVTKPANNANKTTVSAGVLFNDGVTTGINVDNSLLNTAISNAAGTAAWTGVSSKPVELTDGRISTALSTAGVVVSGVKPGIVVTTGGAGLYMGSDFLGYYNGATWKTYMDNSGNFYLGGAGGSLVWNGSTLTINGGGTFTGTLKVGTNPTVTGTGAGTSMSGLGAVFNTGASGSFAIGNSATNIAFDGTTMVLNGNVVKAGNINVTDLGQINPNLGTITGLSSLRIGSGAASFNVDAVGGIWSGSTTYAGAPFSVTNAGVLVAASANITGTINASSGNIFGNLGLGTGGALILSSTGKIYSGSRSSYFNTSPGVFIGGDGSFSFGSGTSYISYDGATNYNISQDVLINGVNAGLVVANAAAGASVAATISGKLDKDGAAILTGPVTLNAANALTVGTPALDAVAGHNGFYIGSTGIVGTKNGVATFTLDTAGNAIFKGDITGATGSFGGVYTGTLSAAMITAGTISASVSLTAATITGGVIGTASGGARTELTATSNGLTSYASDGTTVLASIGSASAASAGSGYVKSTGGANNAAGFASYSSNYTIYTVNNGTGAALGAENVGGGGVGIWAYSNGSYAVRAVSTSVGSYGEGQATGATGVQGFVSGVYSNGIGVHGTGNGTGGIGVNGDASGTNGTGGVFQSTNYIAMVASGSNYGVYSSASTGVWGFSKANGIGVEGSIIYNGTGGVGVKGDSNATSSIGVRGEASGSASQAGSFYATGSGSMGVWVSSASSYGVYSSATGTYAFYAGTGAATGSQSIYGYGPFTGAHDSLTVKTEVIESGDIVVDTAIVGKAGVSDTIATITKSTTPNQKCVLGVYAGKNPVPNKPAGDAPYTGPNAMGPMPDADYTAYQSTHDCSIINALGEGQINVVKEGGNIEAGDYIVTSSTAGKGMRQADDLYRNITVARARESVVWDAGDSSVKMISCIYLSG